MTSKYAAVHASPNGAGDARPTAVQIVNDEGLEGKWEGKVILITGCSSGLGVETAKALATTGATLYLTARDIAKVKTALGSLSDLPNVHLLELDLASLDSVRACAREVLAKTKTLDILIANAGVMACPEGRTIDGYETQFATNHLGHFLLFHLLKPLLLASSSPDFNSRVVFLSSFSHRLSGVTFDNINLADGYHPFIAYAQSKTANIWTANEIERRYGAEGLHAWSVQPGGITTGLVQHLDAETLSAMGKDPVLALVAKSPEQGAATTVWAATAKTLEGRGGKYLEDCQVIGEWKMEDGQWATGYAGHAYDVEKEARLWKVSLEMVGLKEE